MVGLLIKRVPKFTNNITLFNGLMKRKTRGKSVLRIKCVSFSAVFSPDISLRQILVYVEKNALKHM